MTGCSTHSITTTTLLQGFAPGESDDEKIKSLKDESQDMHQSHSETQVSI